MPSYFAVPTTDDFVSSSNPKVSNARNVLSSPPASFDAPGNEGDIYYGEQATVYYEDGAWRFVSTVIGSGDFPHPID